MKPIMLYTDGACLGNPGPGGWASILIYGDHIKELSGGEPQSTNNRMELMGVIAGLRQLKTPCAVTIITDSKYVLQGFTEWMPGWIRKGWKTADNKPVKNVDLWQALAETAKTHQLTWKWVKGHSGNQYNERADVLAVAAAQAMRAS